jgi:aminoglycoside/choline kinase family phosphotransferase
MTDRATRLNQFLQKAGCDVASLQMVAGDASNRKYSRVKQSGVTRIVMDAPPAKGEDVRPFIEIANWLEGLGLSAPHIFEADEEQGFLLIEDLGDDLFARLLEAKKADETTLYQACADVLLCIHDAEPPNLELYSASTMADMAQLAVVWYRGHVYGQDSEDIEHTFRESMHQLLLPLDDTPQVLIQRDYHAENLLWLPERTGPGRVGLLDFQDAMLGHPAYDLVSVLQDARRDVDEALQEQIIAYFLNRTPHTEGFVRAYHLLGLQRNLRILGVFARLCVRDGKVWYVDYIPRVWGHIIGNLRALGDETLTNLVTSTLPEPTEDTLQILRAKCP